MRAFFDLVRHLGGSDTVICVAICVGVFIGDYLLLHILRLFQYPAM